MYLATTINGASPHYYIRESYLSGNHYKSRTLFDLGTDPTRFIRYPGGNSYYFDDIIIDTLERLGVEPDQDALDVVFWDFLNPEIRRVINGFQRRGSSKTNASDSRDEIDNQPLHMFDKRRLHYLRFAQTDQSRINQVPERVFKILRNKSRDEIEQYFIREEQCLRAGEISIYLFVIFDLSRFFREAYAKNLPGALSRDKMDRHFLDEICRLNRDEHFWGESPTSSVLQDYLVKYVIFYFDHDFPSMDPMNAYIRDFMNRHRIYRPPESVRIKMEEIGRLFGKSVKTLKQMSRRDFTRLYRQLALKHHPDKGGRQETFIKLNRAYQILLKRKPGD